MRARIKTSQTSAQSVLEGDKIRLLFDRLLSDEQYAKEIYNSMAETDDLTERAKGFDKWYEDIKLTAFQIKMHHAQSRANMVYELEKIKNKNRNNKKG